MVGKGSNELFRKNWNRITWIDIVSPSNGCPGVRCMKTIIDADTGELIEVETENEIAERILVQSGAISQQTYEEMESYLYYKERFEIIKYEIEKAMREHSIKKWETDEFSFTTTEDTMQKRVDTDRLKEDGLYEKYLKLVPVKGSIRFTLKGKK